MVHLFTVNGFVLSVKVSLQYLFCSVVLTTTYRQLRVSRSLIPPPRHVQTHPRVFPDKFAECHAYHL